MIFTSLFFTDPQSAQSHYLNLRWIIVNGNIRNKLQWNVNQNKKNISYKKMQLKISSAKLGP